MPSNAFETEKRAESYSQIAVFYDYLMRHVRYDRWFRYLKSLLATHCRNYEHLLEIACGTGIMLHKFGGEGRTLYGMDKSLEMLRVAKKKTAGRRPPVLWNGDMRAFAVRRKMDAVICLYDSINYCLTDADLARTWRSVNGCLRSGGIFIFDVCTVWNCRNHFHDYHEEDHHAGCYYTRWSQFDPESGLQLNEFHVYPKTGSDEAYCERHYQKIYPLAHLRALLDESNQWETLGIYDNFSRRPGTEKSDRVHFVVRKK